MPSVKACPAPDCRAANPPQRDASVIWPTMAKPQNGRGQQWSAVTVGAFTPALAMSVGSGAIWITPWSASDGSRLPSGPYSARKAQETWG